MELFLDEPLTSTGVTHELQNVSFAGIFNTETATNISVSSNKDLPASQQNTEAAANTTASTNEGLPISRHDTDESSGNVGRYAKRRKSVMFEDSVKKSRGEDKEDFS